MDPQIANAWGLQLLSAIRYRIDTGWNPFNAAVISVFGWAADLTNYLDGMTIPVDQQPWPRRPQPDWGLALMDHASWVASTAGTALIWSLGHWILQKGKNSVPGGIPFVSGALQGFLQAVDDQLSQTLGDWASALAAGILNLGRDFAYAVQNVIGPRLGNVETWVETYEPRIHNLEFDDQVLFRGWFRDLWNVRDLTNQRLFNLELDDRELFRPFVNEAGLWIRGAEQRLLNLEHDDRDFFRPQLDVLGQWQGKAEGRLQALERYLASLGGLAEFEKQTDARLQLLERAKTADEGKIQEHEQELAILMILATLAELGLLGVGRLKRVAQGECGCHSEDEYSDLEGRVAALEVNSG